MKTQITKVMVAMMLLASGFLANANEGNREISLSTENSKSVILKMNNLAQGTEVTLWNEEGKILFKDQVNESNYSKVFNLKQLEKGELTLEVESAESLEILPIKVTEENAQFVKSNEKTFQKPIVKLYDDMVKVYLSEGHNVYEMKMTDQFGSSVYKERISEKDGGLMRYDVSKLSKGRYNIQFTADGRSFYHTIIIK
mgnify:CR=1 FL=1